MLIQTHGANILSAAVDSFLANHPLISSGPEGESRFLPQHHLNVHKDAIDTFGARSIYNFGHKIFSITTPHNSPVILQPTKYAHGKPVINFARLTRTVKDAKPVVFFRPLEKETTDISPMAFFLKSIQQLGFDIRLASSVDQLKESVAQLKPDIVCFSGYQDDWGSLSKGFIYTKKIKQNIITLLGGFAAIPEAARFFDIVSTGEGEIKLPFLLRTLQEMKSQKTIGNNTPLSLYERLIKFPYADNDDTKAARVKHIEFDFLPQIGKVQADEIMMASLARYVDAAPNTSEALPINISSQLYFKTHEGFRQNPIALNAKVDSVYAANETELDVLAGQRHRKIKFIAQTRGDTKKFDIIEQMLRLGFELRIGLETLDPKRAEALGKALVGHGTRYVKDVKQQFHKIAAIAKSLGIENTKPLFVYMINMSPGEEVDTAAREMRLQLELTLEIWKAHQLVPIFANTPTQLSFWDDLITSDLSGFPRAQFDKENENDFSFHHDSGLLKVGQVLGRWHTLGFKENGAQKGIFQPVFFEMSRPTITFLSEMTDIHHSGSTLLRRMPDYKRIHATLVLIAHTDSSKLKILAEELKGFKALLNGNAYLELEEQRDKDLIQAGDMILKTIGKTLSLLKEKLQDLENIPADVVSLTEEKQFLHEKITKFRNAQSGHIDPKEYMDKITKLFIWIKQTLPSPAKEIFEEDFEWLSSAVSIHHVHQKEDMTKK